MAIEFDRECFFIAPIGEEGSDVRKRSDDVRDWVLKPAAASAADLEVVRADDVGEPGQITAQAVQHCLRAKAAVADLTGGNPNVYYELSVRHGAQLPVVLIAEVGTKLPFDISQSRVVFFDHRDLSSVGRATGEIEDHLKASLEGPADNPISDGMRLAQLQAGDAEEQTLALVLDRLQRLATLVEGIDEGVARGERRETIKKNISTSSYSAELLAIRERLKQEAMDRGETLQEFLSEDDGPDAEVRAEILAERDQERARTGTPTPPARFKLE